MKKLILIGAGGMGLEILDVAKNSIGYGTIFSIKGFLDDNESADTGGAQHLGTISNYRLQMNDVFVCTLGDIKLKEVLVQRIIDKGGVFMSLIHKESDVNASVSIKEGCIVMRNAHLGNNARLESHVLTQIGSVIGHHVEVQSFARIDCYAICVGGSKIGKGSIVHSGSVINHNVEIGTHGVVGANSFVIRDVKNNTTVYGNPAKRI